MPITLYSYKLKRWAPLLSDEEFRPIARALDQRVKAIRLHMGRNGASLDQARRRSSGEALDIYERLTGVRLSHPDELYAVRLSQYGWQCPRCAKPFRTPKAKLCAECGFELPPGQVAGPAG